MVGPRQVWIAWKELNQEWLERDQWQARMLEHWSIIVGDLIFLLNFEPSNLRE
jgi:hypothetical protein